MCLTKEPNNDHSAQKMTPRSAPQGQIEPLSMINDLLGLCYLQCDTNPDARYYIYYYYIWYARVCVNLPPKYLITCLAPYLVPTFLQDD